VEALTTAEWVQTVSAAAAAIAALAALATVWLSRAQARTAREALEAQTRPLIADVPRGFYRDPPEASDERSSRRDPADVSVGVYSGSDSERPSFGAFVPVRNVGNGAALIESVRFEVGDEVVEASAETLVLPPGELTRVGFMVDEGEPAAAAAESIAAVLDDFSVAIEFSDAIGHHRDEVRLEVGNGRYPYVKARSVLARILEEQEASEASARRSSPTAN
jgi:hypothetical protein